MTIENTVSTLAFAEPNLAHLIGGDVRAKDVNLRRLHAALAAAAAERGPVDFRELLVTPGVGPRTVRALAQVAEVVRCAPYALIKRRGFRTLTAARTGILLANDEIIRVVKSWHAKSEIGVQRRAEDSNTCNQKVES